MRSTKFLLRPTSCYDQTTSFPDGEDINKFRNVYVANKDDPHPGSPGLSELVEQNPDLHEKYDLLNNMGYGTKKHL